MNKFEQCAKDLNGQVGRHSLIGIDVDGVLWGILDGNQSLIRKAAFKQVSVFAYPGEESHDRQRPSFHVQYGDIV